MGQPTEPQPTAAAELRRMWRDVNAAYHLEPLDEPQIFVSRLEHFASLIGDANSLFCAGDLALLADIQTVYMAQCEPKQENKARHLFAKLFTFAETTWANMDELACFVMYIERLIKMATSTKIN